ncbi:MAG: diguanylate cyclase [Spirochaetales bacterium]
MIDPTFLRSVEIFSTLSDDELANVRRFLQERSLAAPATVFRQGDAGDELFVVREGSVAVRVISKEGEEVDVAELGVGDFFGEMAIFEDAARSASCVLVEGGSLLVLCEHDFFAMMKEHPRTALKILDRMVSITTQRLTKTSSFLSELVQWGEAARRRAITDELTGLYNRRHLDAVLEQHYAEARISQERFSLIMMDLDHFHSINDTYGQSFGDSVIRQVAPAVTANLRDTDIAARYGGDEFTLILPSMSAEEARDRAEAIRRAVEGLRIESPAGALGVTTSQGIAEFPRHADDLERLKLAADQALYKAKEAGRNRAMIIG